MISRLLTLRKFSNCLTTLRTNSSQSSGGKWSIEAAVTRSVGPRIAAIVQHQYLRHSPA
jgi:hypothetical protein